MNQKIAVGSKISVKYTGKFDNGRVFDSTRNKSPLTFTVGSGYLIDGFEKAVIGMVKGEKKHIKLSPKEGYGLYRKDLVVDIPRKEVPADMQLHIGMKLEMADSDGNPIPVKVKRIEKDKITMDANHPYAGKALNFDIEIVGVN